MKYEKKDERWVVQQKKKENRQLGRHVENPITKARLAKERRSSGRGYPCWCTVTIGSVSTSQRGCPSTEEVVMKALL